MACGCSTERVRIEPVRERIITHQNVCAAQPVVSSRTTYVPECPSCYWVQPDTSHPAYVIGNFLTAPFRLVTGRSLGQPDVVATRTYSEPMGQRVTSVTTRTKSYLDQCGNIHRKVTISNNGSMLEPVGERLTTVKVIRTKPMLQPVAERTIIRTLPACPQPVISESCDPCDNPYR